MAHQLQNVLGSKLVFSTTQAGKPYIENNVRFSGIMLLVQPAVDA